ncbi:hypothetical protein QTP86_018625, partial [Hemibagrus guttatus]
MRETFHYRQQMFHVPQQSVDILQVFPHFMDTKGLFSPLTLSAESATWFLFLLCCIFSLHNQLEGKLGEAIHLVKFHKTCQSLDDHLITIERNPQPYLLATVISKAQVFSFYIVLERKLFPCPSLTFKTKKLVIDFRREKGRTHDPIHINGMAVKHVTSFMFLGTHISEDLSWTTNTSSLVKKAHQHLFYLNTLKKNHLSSIILVNFYCCAIESILTNCIIV